MGNHKTLLVGVLAAWSLCALAAAGPIEVIYTEITGQPSAVVPGTRDATGQPVFAEWVAVEDLALRHDGGQWMIKGRSTLATTLDSILILGSGKVGNAFAQDGQPLQGGVAGEQYDFFDSPVPAAWDEYGNIAFSCRAKGGSSTVFEKVIVYNGVTHTIVHQMGDPALDLVDNPPGASGDELFGNSINSVYLRNDGYVGFVNTPIQNCHSSRYPAYFVGSKAFAQSGVSTIGTETWDSFVYDNCGGTPDGFHWFARGDTENPNTAIDDILAVDGQIVLQEGSPVAGTGPTMAAIFFARMLSDGTWFCRGDDPADNDWAVRSGVLMAKTGDLITGTEHWGNAFSAFTGNHVGDWLLAGNTDIGDTSIDNVLVLNGGTVLARENDPIDLDGNGLFDDNVYIATFQPNDLHISDGRMVWFLATLRNSAGTGIGDAFLRIPYYPYGDLNCDGAVNNQDIDHFIQALFNAPGYIADHDGSPYPPCDIQYGDFTGDGAVNNQDIDGFVAALFA